MGGGQVPARASGCRMVGSWSTRPAAGTQVSTLIDCCARSPQPARPPFCTADTKTQGIMCTACIALEGLDGSFVPARARIGCKTRAEEHKLAACVPKPILVVAHI